MDYVFCIVCCNAAMQACPHLSMKHTTRCLTPPKPPADAVDSQVSETQLVEAQLGADVASGRVLYYEVDKEGQVSVLHRESFSKQLKKVGGVAQEGGRGSSRRWEG